MGGLGGAPDIRFEIGSFPESGGESTDQDGGLTSTLLRRISAAEVFCPIHKVPPRQPPQEPGWGQMPLEPSQHAPRILKILTQKILISVIPPQIMHHADPEE